MKNKQVLNGIQVNELDSLNTSNSLVVTAKQDNNIGTTNMAWNIQTSLMNEICNISKVYNSKHGLFASVPIVCRGQDCVYKDTCMISQQNRIVGQRCPMEIAAILSRYQQWCNHFEIDTSNDFINPEDLVDATLIKDLVNIEIQILRAENKVALSGDFMSTTLLDIDKKCNAYYGKIVSPETEFLMTLQDKKIKILNQLNATRKDKANDKNKNSASDTAIRIFQQVQELEKSKQTVSVTEIQFSDDGEIIDNNMIQPL